MSNWFTRAMVGWFMQSVTPPVSEPPMGDELAALGIKADTLSYPFDSTKQDVDLIKGTVAACLHARATERGAIRFIVNCKNEELQKRLQKVLNKPNPLMSRVDLMEVCSHFHDATGNAVLYFVRDADNIPSEVWVLPSFYFVAIFEEPEDPVPSAYRWADGRVITRIENLCIIRQNSVKTAPYTGRGFLADQYDNAVLYDLVVQGQKNWFYSGGAPNIALVQPKDSLLTSQQISDMQTMWNNKYNPATGTSNIAVLPDGVTPTNFGPQELNFNESKDEIRDSIREALQVPKVLLGDTDDVNLNNGVTAMAIFDRTVVIRYAEKFASALECYFQEQFGDDITVDVDPRTLSSFAELTQSMPTATNKGAQGTGTHQTVNSGIAHETI